MFVESEKINNIKSFLNNSFGEILIDTERKIFHNRNFIADKVDSSYFNLILGKLIYVKNENTFIDNKVLEKITYIKECKARNKIILSGELEIDYPDVSCNYYIYDLETEEIFNLFNFKNLFDLISFENNIIFGTKQEIVLYSFSQKFNPLWQFSLSSLGKFKNIYTNEEETIEVRQFIGVYNNILWLFLNKTGFIGLDITTGNLKHHIQKNDVLIGETAVTSYTENENGRMSFFRSQYYLDEQKGKIIGLAVDMLFEMDLNRDTPFVTQYGLQKQYQKYGINEQNIANDFVLKDNLLYFYAFNQLKFGILNIKTKEVIYISEPIIPENNKVTQLKDLQVSDNKIYILDSGNTLHIFEEEAHS